jgi:hypothetical protein
MDVLIYGGRPLSKELYEQAIELKRVMIAIQKGGAKGEF